jgi:hypothetical protein
LSSPVRRVDVGAGSAGLLDVDDAPVDNELEVAYAAAGVGGARLQGDGSGDGHAIGAAAGLAGWRDVVADGHLQAVRVQDRAERAVG